MRRNQGRWQQPNSMKLDSKFACFKKSYLTTALTYLLDCSVQGGNEKHELPSSSSCFWEQDVGFCLRIGEDMRFESVTKQASQDCTLMTITSEKLLWSWQFASFKRLSHAWWGMFCANFHFFKEEIVPATRNVRLNMQQSRSKTWATQNCCLKAMVFV